MPRRKKARWVQRRNGINMTPTIVGLMVGVATYQLTDNPILILLSVAGAVWMLVALASLDSILKFFERVIVAWLRLLEQRERTKRHAISIDGRIRLEEARQGTHIGRLETQMTFWLLKAQGKLPTKSQADDDSDEDGYEVEYRLVERD